MGDTNSSARSAAAWELARRQHGVVTRGDLLRLGFTPKAIRHRIASGRLHRLMRGVYAVGWPGLTREGRWMAAVRVCGEGAVLSHSSAAALWEIGPERAGGIDVSVRRDCAIRRPGIRARGRAALPESDVTLHRGIPVTTPARTLLDEATELNARQLERMVNEADKQDLIDPEELRKALEGHGGDPGVRPLRKLLDQHTFRLSDSELEVLFRPIARRAGLPPPLTKQFVNGFEVDFFWPRLDLVIETDGLQYHRTPAAQARDRLRDQTHVAAGLTQLRFTHWQVRHEPQRVRRVLAKTARRLAAASDTAVP